MATVGIVATFCSGGNHAEITLRVNNVVQGTWSGVEYDDIRAPVTEDEKATFARLLIKLKKLGITDAQLKSALLAGFTVTV